MTQESREEIDVAHQGVGNAGLRHAPGMGNNEGDAHGVLEERVLFADSVPVEHLAVVTRVDDNRVFPESADLQSVDESADAGVDVRDKAVVGRDRASNHLLREIPELVVVHPFDDAAGFVGVVDAVVRQLADCVGIVERVEPCGGAPRRMRRTVPDVGEERPVCIPPLQETERGVGDHAVPHRVFRIRERLTLDIPVAVFPHFRDDVRPVVSLLDILTHGPAVRLRVALPGIETECPVRVLARNVVIHVQEACPEGGVARVTEVDHQRAHARGNERLIRPA